MSRFKDLQFVMRTLLRDRGFTLTAILTLTICIGANTALFSVVNSVLLNPLPVPESERLVVMYNSYPRAGVERAANGVPDYFDRLRELSDVLEDQALFQQSGLTVGEEGNPQRVSGLEVTPSFFRVLRSMPAYGRLFSEEEGEIGNERKAVLSHALWQQLYGGSVEALGQEIRISGQPYTIVGILPEAFLFLNPSVRIWIPLAFTDEQKSDERRHSNSWENIGRLKAGATLEQVRAQLEALTEANHERFPHFKQLLLNAGYHVQAHFLKDEMVRSVEGTLYLLWGGVVLVLLIGAVNVSNLVTARSSIRQRDQATRIAMGASHWRLTRLLFLESLVVCGSAFGLGVGLGVLGLRGAVAMGLDDLPRGSEIAVSSTVLALVLGLSLGVTVLITVIPMARMASLDLNSVFREESRTGTSSRGTRWLRNGLASAQVAFALILLLCAGLLLQSFRLILAIDPGFRQGQTVLTGRISLPSLRYPDGPSLRSFANRLLPELKALPGVIEAGLTTSIPFGGNNNDSVILAEGYQMQPGESLVSPNQIVVSQSYFEALGIPILAGRSFDETDTADGRRTIIVDDRLVRHFWPGQVPLGKRMFFPEDLNDLTAITPTTTFFEVVGVVKSVKLRDLADQDERVGAYYFPFEQSPQRSLALAVKASDNPTALTTSIRRAVASLDPELPFYDTLTLQQRLDSSLTTRRAPMLLAVIFGAIALLLAAVGIYGVLAYVVSQRTREFGIRMALGSDRGGVFRLIFGDGAKVLGIGLAAGMIGVLVLSRFLESVLYGVHPLSPPIILSVAGLLLLVAAVSCLIPAWRATRVDPAQALTAM